MSASQPTPMTLLQVQYIENGDNVYKVLVPKDLEEPEEDLLSSHLSPRSVDPIICKVQSASNFKSLCSIENTEMPCFTSFTNLSSQFKTVKSLVKFPIASSQGSDTAGASEAPSESLRLLQKELQANSNVSLSTGGPEEVPSTEQESYHSHPKPMCSAESVLTDMHLSRVSPDYPDCEIQVSLPETGEVIPVAVHVQGTDSSSVVKVEQSEEERNVGVFRENSSTGLNLDTPWLASNVSEDTSECEIVEEIPFNPFPTLQNSINVHVENDLLMKCPTEQDQRNAWSSSTIDLSDETITLTKETTLTVDDPTRAFIRNTIFPGESTPPNPRSQKVDSYIQNIVDGTCTLSIPDDDTGCDSKMPCTVKEQQDCNLAQECQDACDRIRKLLSDLPSDDTADQATPVTSEQSIEPFETKSNESILLSDITGNSSLSSWPPGFSFVVKPGVGNAIRRDHNYSVIVVPQKPDNNEKPVCKVGCVWSEKPKIPVPMVDTEWSVDPKKCIKTYSSKFCKIVNMRSEVVPIDDKTGASEIQNDRESTNRTDCSVSAVFGTQAIAPLTKVSTTSAEKVKAQGKGGRKVIPSPFQISESIASTVDRYFEEQKQTARGKVKRSPTKRAPAKQSPGKRSPTKRAPTKHSPGKQSSPSKKRGSPKKRRRRKKVVSRNILTSVINSSQDVLKENNLEAEYNADPRNASLSKTLERIRKSLQDRNTCKKNTTNKSTNKNLDDEKQPVKPIADNVNKTILKDAEHVKTDSPRILFLKALEAKLQGESDSNEVINTSHSKDSSNFISAKSNASFLKSSENKMETDSQVSLNKEQLLLKPLIISDHTDSFDLAEEIPTNVKSTRNDSFSGKDTETYSEKSASSGVPSKRLGDKSQRKNEKHIQDSRGENKQCATEKQTSTISKNKSKHLPLESSKSSLEASEKLLSKDQAVRLHETVNQRKAVSILKSRCPDSKYMSPSSGQEVARNWIQPVQQKPKTLIDKNHCMSMSDLGIGNSSSESTPKNPFPNWNPSKSASDSVPNNQSSESVLRNFFSNWTPSKSASDLIPNNQSSESVLRNFCPNWNPLNSTSDLVPNIQSSASVLKNIYPNCNPLNSTSVLAPNSQSSASVLKNIYPNWNPSNSTSDLVLNNPSSESALKNVYPNWTPSNLSSNLVLNNPSSESEHKNLFPNCNPSHSTNILAFNNSSSESVLKIVYPSWNSSNSTSNLVLNNSSIESVPKNIYPNRNPSNSISDLVPNSRSSGFVSRNLFPNCNPLNTNASASITPQKDKNTSKRNTINKHSLTKFVEENKNTSRLLNVETLENTAGKSKVKQSTLVPSVQNIISTEIMKRVFLLSRKQQEHKDCTTVPNDIRLQENVHKDQILGNKTDSSKMIQHAEQNSYIDNQKITKASKLKIKNHKVNKSNDSTSPKSKDSQMNTGAKLGSPYQDNPNERKKVKHSKTKSKRNLSAHVPESNEHAVSNQINTPAVNQIIRENQHVSIRELPVDLSTNASTSRNPHSIPKGTTDCIITLSDTDSSMELDSEEEIFPSLEKLVNSVDKQMSCKTSAVSSTKINKGLKTPLTETTLAGKKVPVLKPPFTTLGQQASYNLKAVHLVENKETDKIPLSKKPSSRNKTEELPFNTLAKSVSCKSNVKKLGKNYDTDRKYLSENVLGKSKFQKQPYTACNTPTNTKLHKKALISNYEMSKHPSKEIELVERNAYENVFSVEGDSSSDESNDSFASDCSLFEGDSFLASNSDTDKNSCSSSEPSSVESDSDFEEAGSSVISSLNRNDVLRAMKNKQYKNLISQYVKYPRKTASDKLRQSNMVASYSQRTKLRRSVKSRELASLHDPDKKEETLGTLRSETRQIQYASDKLKLRNKVVVDSRNEEQSNFTEKGLQLKGIESRELISLFDPDKENETLGTLRSETKLLKRVRDRTDAVPERTSNVPCPVNETADHYLEVLVKPCYVRLERLKPPSVTSAANEVSKPTPKIRKKNKNKRQDKIDVLLSMVKTFLEKEHERSARKKKKELKRSMDMIFSALGNSGSKKSKTKLSKYTKHASSKEESLLSKNSSVDEVVLHKPRQEPSKCERTLYGSAHNSTVGTITKHVVPGNVFCSSTTAKRKHDLHSAHAFSQDRHETQDDPPKKAKTIQEQYFDLVKDFMEGQ